MTIKRAAILIITFFSFEVWAGPFVEADGSYAVTAMTAAGDKIAAAHFDGTIRIFDPASSKLVRSLEGHSKPVISISSDFGGKRILSVGQDGRLILWDADSGNIIHKITRPGVSFRACALSPSGKYALAAYGGTVSVWEVSAWENIFLWENIEGGAYSLAISEDEKTAAVGGAKGEINIYSLPSGDILKKLKKGRETVASLAFAPASGLLVSGGYDKTARVWNVENGSLAAEFSLHTDTVRAVGAAVGGKMFASAGDDGAVYLWNIVSGKTKTFSEADGVSASALALDPALRFAAAGKGTVFGSGRYALLWFPSKEGVYREIYSFSEGTAVLSSSGFVMGSGAFAQYVTIYERGKRLAPGASLSKYVRPDKFLIDIGAGYPFTGGKTADE